MGSGVLVPVVFYLGFISVMAVNKIDPNGSLINPAAEILSSTTAVTNLTVPSLSTTLSMAHSTHAETTTDVPTSTVNPSTTQVSSTTTSKPNPPAPSPGTWMVNEKNTTCILVKFTVSFAVPYMSATGKIVNSSAFPLSENASASGSCFQNLAGSQEIMLQWENATMLQPQRNMLEIIFQRNNSGSPAKDNSQFFIEGIKLKIYTPDSDYFPNATSVYTSGSLKDANLFTTSINNSYRCNSEIVIDIPVDINYGNSTQNTTATIFLKHLQLEAFRTQYGGKFSTALDCPADGMLTSDIVPIAVGCALAALVVIVLIAYLIGRRRARQRGYQSV